MKRIIGIVSKGLRNDIGFCIYHPIADNTLLGSAILHMVESLHHLASATALQPELVVPKRTHLHARVQC